MKTREQQELCQAIEAFREKQDGEVFNNLIQALFKSPLYIPQGTGERQGQFLMVNKENQSMFPAFTDMEEAGKGNLGDVEFKQYTIEEYANIVAGMGNIQGMVINIFEKNCIIAKDFFVKVVIPAFAENHILPGLKSTATGEYVAITKVPFSVGRSEQADLHIADKSVNELHGLIMERDLKYYVVDRDSLNGIYVNGNKVDKEQEIEFDDVIEFSDEEYTFVPLGIANRTQIEPTIYGDEGMMVANSMFFMQNRVLINGFFEKTEDFLKDFEEVEEMELFRRYFLVSVETTCAMREKEQNITDEKIIHEQRKAMLGKSTRIFKNGDYGFTKAEQEDGVIFIVNFPAMLYIPGLSRRMYLVAKDNGDKAVFVVRIMPDKEIKLIKVGTDNSETDYGVAPDTQEEELAKVLEIGV